MRYLMILVISNFIASFSFAQSSEYGKEIKTEIDKVQSKGEATLEFLYSTKKPFYRSDLEKMIESKIDDSNALNYAKVLDFNYQEMIDKVNTACYYNIENIANFNVLLQKGYQDNIVESFYIGEVAKRVWGEFVYDYYVILVTKKESIIFVVNNQC